MTDAAPQAPLSFAARIQQLAAEKPDALAVTCAETALSWGDLHRRSNRVARALAVRGVKLGDLVTIGLPNSTGFIEAAVACWKLGATPQPISSRLPAAEIKGVVDLADSPVVIGKPDLAVDRPRLDIDDLLAASADESDLPDAVSPSWKAPTSGGSTGRPKLILSGAPSVLTATAGGLWRLGPDEGALMAGPLYHTAPLGQAAAALLAGGHLVLTPKFDAEGVLRAVDRHKATWVYLVPTMMSRIWRLPEDVRGAYDVSSLRTVWHLAAPCPPWLKEAWIDWLGHEVIWELYGGTEAQAITVLNGTEWLAHRGSVGRVVAGQMKIVRPDGADAAPGEVGEIYMKPADAAPATYRYRGAEARVIDGGWESLGDIGRFDEDGFLYLADRRTDMILVGGSNVYPAEVEAAIDEHPLVQSSCVIGLPDEDLGNRVHAIVQARPGLDIEALLGHLSERLVAYKRPRTVELVDHPLRDEAGKVRRSALRKERLARA